MKDHTISQEITLLDALSRICALAPEPLVLFVLDNEKKMVGTLTEKADKLEGDNSRLASENAYLRGLIKRYIYPAAQRMPQA